MKKEIGPGFGIASGVATSMGLFVYVIVLAILIFLKKPVSLSYLIVTFLTAKLIGEWFFWSSYRKEISEMKKQAGWLSLPINHPNFWIMMGTIFFDQIIEVALVNLGVNKGIELIWIFFTLAFMQAISAWLMGWLSDRFRRKNVLAGLELLVLGLMLLSLNVSSKEYFFLVLGIKGAFIHITTVSRALIMDTFEMLAKIKTSIK